MGLQKESGQQGERRDRLRTVASLAFVLSVRWLYPAGAGPAVLQLASLLERLYGRSVLACAEQSENCWGSVCRAGQPSVTVHLPACL